MDVRPAALLLALAGLAWVAWSQLGEETALRQEADLTACRGRVCTVRLTKKSRNLFGYAFTYRTYGEHALSLTVTCTRALWLVGSYRCELSELGPAADDRWERE